MILHIDMDAFFASVEQTINPRLKGRPLIVGSRGNKYHTVVCAASYEAKRLGIDSGMPTKEAFLICPNASFVEADSAKYIYTSESIYSMLFDYDPNPQYVSVDEFQLDLRNINEDDQKALALEIKQRINKRFNITCSIGIAKNCLLSKLASKLKKPDGLCVLNKDNIEQILKDVPTEMLCGVGPRTNEILNRLKIYTCLDMLNTKQVILNTYLGKVGYELFLSLKAKDSFPIKPQEKRDIKSIGHSYTLNKATSNQVFVKAWIRLLSEMVGFRLRQKSLMAKTVHFWTNSSHLEPQFSMQKTFQLATSDGQEICSRCLKIANTPLKNSTAIRALGVSCSNLVNNEDSLLKEVKKREEVIKSIDNINHRYGDWTIFPANLTLINRKFTQ